MSLSTFALSEPAIAQVAAQTSTKTPPKRRIRALSDQPVMPEAR